ncbi:hypothetical protein Q499_0379 [Chlamydia suis MD56]|uniref:hypothetical protein n=1 Tax=Chlamydia suis TaxID=83559 RepID=UPI0003C000BA|nr:hypothetical protein [Chlamydia suis]ESN89352.1 hypothetical protein Q499_0379 [Chlamydia suis MD56]
MAVLRTCSVSGQAPVSFSPSSNQKVQNHKSGLPCSKVAALLAISLLAVGIILTTALLAPTGGFAYILVAGILALHLLIALALGFWIASPHSTASSLQYGEPKKII